MTYKIIAYRGYTGDDKKKHTDVSFLKNDSLIFTRRVEGWLSIDQIYVYKRNISNISNINYDLISVEIIK